ncbi:HNH endonuclease family protein [Hamadaea tsunoensis]|uniref:HNH endonuclease family protein n=1 Tax=Hamadaea tsunoensis TaxID=53368 RepID=UPI00041C595C|nr:HNH endonuclease family protein [Hamadaea tsunoensis]
MKRYRGEIITLVVLVLVAAAVAWFWDTGHQEEPAAQPPTLPKSGVATKAQAVTLLGKLPREAQSHWDSYDRLSFGDPLWTDDTDAPGGHNGCDTRDDVLRRDLTGVRLGTTNPCVVLSGVLADPYTGRKLPYDRSRASEIEIDHVVAVAAAWRSGAWAWPPQRRRAFANDTDNLLAADKTTNQDKRSQTADNWKPPRAAAWCDYAKRYVTAKSRYALTVTTAEGDALGRMLSTCS